MAASLLTLRAIHATAVEVPMARPLATGALTMRTAPLLLINLETEEGITGRAYLFCYTRMALGPIAMVLADIQHAVRGKCLAPVDLSTRLLQRYRLLGAQGIVRMALAGFDVACWDAPSLVAGLPLASYIGPQPRPIPAYNSNGLGLMSPEQAADEAEALLEHGFRAEELRLGRATAEEDLAVVRAERRRLPDTVALMTDYNQARAAGRRLPFATAINGYLLQWAGRIILVDAGAGGFMGPHLGKLQTNLEAACITPADVDNVLLTHMHTDHVGGLLAPDGTALFAQAVVMVSALEIAYWRNRSNQDSSPATSRDASDISANVVAAYGDRFVTFDRPDMTPGIKAIALPGHTPGHTGFDFTADVGPFVIWGDICHAPEVQCPRPDVTVVFDVSPTDAIESRRKMLARAVDQDLLIAGMHMPFPGFTRIARSADAYTHHPEVWQYDLLS